MHREELPCGREKNRMFVDEGGVRALHWQRCKMGVLQWQRGAEDTN